MNSFEHDGWTIVNLNNRSTFKNQLRQDRGFLNPKFLRNSLQTDLSNSERHRYKEYQQVNFMK